jgi:hypothetical protein
MDLLTKLLVQNNLLSLKSEDCYSLLKERILGDLSQKEVKQLLPFQRRQIEVNCAIVSLLQGKVSGLLAFADFGLILIVGIVLYVPLVH